MPVRTSSLRSLGAFLNVFAIESFMDELAEAAGADPAAFRLAHLTDPRARRVIEEVTAASGLGGPAPGRGHRLRPGLRPVQGPGRVLRGRGRGGRGHQHHAAPPVARRGRRPGDQPGRGAPTRSRAARSRARAGRCASGSASTATRITSVTWDSYPILRFTEVPGGHGADRRRAGRAGDRAPGNSPRARWPAPSATPWPTRSGCGSATCRSPPSR